MLKKLIIMSIVLFITAFNAHAADYSWAKAGAYGQLSNSTVLATFFMLRPMNIWSYSLM